MSTLTPRCHLWVGCKLLMTIVAIVMGLELCTMDVPRAFLNSEMSQYEIFVELGGRCREDPGGQWGSR
jgi:hypothetical protein